MFVYLISSFWEFYRACKECVVCEQFVERLSVFLAVSEMDLYESRSEMLPLFFIPLLAYNPTQPSPVQSGVSAYLCVFVCDSGVCGV